MTAIAHHLPTTLASLLEPDAYPHEVDAVELVETHLSWVLLTGRYAYKIKRPVRLPFVDLCDPARRAFFCNEELRLNRRFAPELYLEVCAITLDDGRARIAGKGAAIEHCVRMRQFDRAGELDRLVDSGGAQARELAEFGAGLAALQETLPVAAPVSPAGSPSEVRRIVMDNLDECAALGGAAERLAFERFGQRLDLLLDELEPVMLRRKAAGRVRECHGDLHARNVARVDGRLRAFDCIEFEPRFRWIDVAEDLAFLYADLRAREAPELAHAVLGAWLERSGDYEACRMLRVYGAHRLLVRAKVASHAKEPAEHERYLRSAAALLERGRPTLTLMSGPSGSGKSWLAARVAPAIEAIHLRSDVERKRVAGLAQRARTDAGIGEALYSEEMSRRTQGALARAAEDVLRAGWPVIVDATLLRAAGRAEYRKLADRLGVPLRLVACTAPDAVLRERIVERARRDDDPSDADLSVLDWQLAHVEPVQPEEGIAVLTVDTRDPQAVGELTHALRP